MYQQASQLQLNRILVENSKPDATDAMARTQEVLKSSTLKSHQSNKCYGERREEEQRKTQQMNP